MSGESKTFRKRYVSPNEIQLQGLTLGCMILADGFEPDWILVPWRGGAQYGLPVQGFLEAKGIKTNHIAIRTSSYTAPGEQSSTVAVHAVDYFVDNCNAEDEILIVDDVFETGCSIQALIAKIQTRMRKNMPQVIKIAVAFWKPKKNKTNLKPDYWLEETDDWLVFPHEFADLNDEEIKELMGQKVYNLFTASISSNQPEYMNNLVSGEPVATSLIGKKI